MKHVKKFNTEEEKINENYHENQLDRIDLDSEYNAAVQIRSGEGDTKTNWMDLTPESALVLIQWLQHYYRDDNNFIGGLKTKGQRKAKETIKNWRKGLNY